MSVVPFTLEGFEMTPFTSSSGRTRDVYRTGTGPAVIIIHEVPGITPLVAAFGRKVAERGMTAVLPSLLGTPGRPVTIPYALSSLARACVSKEFMLLALNKTSPIVDYLRELAAHEREAHGGPGVGAIGMCLHGRLRARHERRRHRGRARAESAIASLSRQRQAEGIARRL